ncbi:serine/threonine-protein kinase [Geothrix edaphica]|uniref:Protein kinase domain-containing protein n=1 Tax=Geothrix edaphica TaxID=2927976 RepID=A0ABQ5Q136_9BACT|nr:serine/threonine-protein kinase [Geothrix edaphica]GLH68348.1 hypothetical protein GETHED_27120 [Geothrix edaphica]
MAFRIRAALGLGMAPLLMAQAQPTFYAAYQDGLDAEHQGQWKAAATAYRRAIELRPASAARVVIYGNNLLTNYSPHTHLARCLLESGDVNGAQAALGKAAHFDEPKAERDALHHAISQRIQAAPLPNEPASRITPAEAAPLAHSPSHPPPPPPATEPAPPPVPLQPAPGIRAATSAVPPSPARPKAASPAPVEAPISTPAPAQPLAAQGEPTRNWRMVWPIGALLSLAGALLIRRWRRRPLEESSFKDPQQLGPYRIERLLGRGGFASTYLAHHITTKTPVALKLLHPYRHDDPEFLRRFRQEAKLGTMLDHPNLVRMLDPGPETGPPWLAMEYVSGRRLDQVLREGGPPSLPAFLRIALQIAGAMAHAHSLGIVHRDLKPGNVIFDGDQAKVMDFGISRIVDSNTLTTTYAFLGTPRYAAPEAQRKAQVGPAADRYAFGIILFEMLAGHPPFDGETPFEILDQHQRTPLPDLSALRPDVPPELVDLIERLCRKDPDQRPGDEEVIRTLEQFLLESPPAKEP